MANTRITGPVVQNDEQVCLVTEDITLQQYDQYVISTVEGTTITLPDNPFPGESHTIIAQGAGCFLTGLPDFPLIVDPIYIPSGSNTVVVFGTTGWSGGALNHGIDQALFGDGSDGAVVLDGTTAFTNFSSLTGSPPNALYSFTRDTFFATLTVDPTVTVRTGGFRVFVRGALLNTATANINRDGRAGSADTAGAGQAAGTLGASAGGGNGSNNAAGSAGAASASVLANPAGAALQQGGKGGDSIGTIRVGGAAGGVIILTLAQGTVRSLPQAIVGSAISASGVTPLTGGSGGGGGGSSAGTATGGGGGGGGAPVMIAAFVIINNGTISSNGGIGGNAFGSAGNAGGGGGGGGGDVITVSRAYSGNVPTATGGAVGTPFGGADPAVVGHNGGVIQLTA